MKKYIYNGKSTTEDWITNNQFKLYEYGNSKNEQIFVDLKESLSKHLKLRQKPFDIQKTVLDTKVEIKFRRRKYYNSVTLTIVPSTQTKKFQIWR